VTEINFSSYSNNSLSLSGPNGMLGTMEISGT
jgi:hypothetical protein